MTYVTRFIRQTVYYNDRQKLLTNALAFSSTYTTLDRPIGLRTGKHHYTNIVIQALF